jgi:hypothetical protein
LFPVLHIGSACKGGRRRANMGGERLAALLRRFSDVAEVEVINHHLRTYEEGRDNAGCGCREGNRRLFSRRGRNETYRLNRDSSALREVSAQLFVEHVQDLLTRPTLEAKPSWPVAETPREADSVGQECAI